MELRLLIAYGLMVAIVLALSAFTAYRIYHSRTRAYDRRVRKEREAHNARFAKDQD